jgi:hypothetical protein
VIVRSPRPAQDFTIVSNAVIRDSRLSYRARGVLIDVLSRPDDWRTDFKSIARVGKEGESAIRTALEELRAAGYIVQSRVRGERGRWLTVNTVYDFPQENSQVAPSVGFPGVGSPALGNSTPLRSTETKNCEVGPLERGHGSSRDHGLPAGATLRAAQQPEPPRIKPERKRRKLTRTERTNAWNRFLEMDLGDLPDDQEIRGAAFVELEQQHGAINPADWAQAMIDRGEWDGFVASFDLGNNVEVSFGKGA